MGSGKFNWEEWTPNVPDYSPLRDPEEIERVQRRALSQDDEADRAWDLYALAFRLAAGGVWDKAEAVAQSVELPYEQSMAFYEIAAHLLAAGQRERALRNLALAESAARAGTPDYVWQKATVLAKVGKVLLDAGEGGRARDIWEEAIRVARLGEETETGHELEACSSALWETSKYLAVAGDLEQAAAVAEAIKVSGKRDRAIETVRRIATGDPAAIPERE